LLANFSNDLLRGQRGVESNGVIGLFEIGELARQDLFAGKMPVAMADSFGEERVSSF